MKRVKKIVVVVVAVVILVIVAAVVWIDRLAKVGVETGGQFAFGVPTKLDSADIGILAGRSALSGLNIANPPGFDTPHLLKLDNAALAVALGSLTGDTVEIPEFSLTGIDMNLESKSGKANFKVVLDNLGRFESSKKEPQPEKAKGEGKKFVIREIVIKNVKVNVALLPIGGEATRVTVPIDELRLKNVGTAGNNGIELGQVAGTLLKAIILAAMEKGGSIVPGDLLNELKGSMASLAPLTDIGASLAVNIDGTIKDLGAQAGTVGKEVAQQAEGAAKQVGEAAKDAQKKVTGGLGDLFKKKEDKPK
jgi:hypothetical protein